MPDETLKPCPFCGSPDVVSGGPENAPLIACKGCGLVVRSRLSYVPYGPDTFRDHLRGAWTRRATDA